MSFGGFPEAVSDNVVELLCSAFCKVGLTNVSIEYAHRVGVKTNSNNRLIIARFVSRFQRDQILKLKRDLRNNNVFVYEDLCHVDYAERKRVLPIMNAKFQQGHRVKFTKGRLYVDGIPWIE